jgi:hypothetical protein
MHLYLRVCMVCGLLLQCIITFAQHPDSLCAGCNCHTDSPTPPAGIMISHVHPKGQWMVSYRYMTMSMRGEMDGNSKVSDHTVFTQYNYAMSATTMRMDMHMLMIMYGLTHKITLMAMMNYNINSMNMVPFAPTMMMNMPGMSANTTAANVDMNMRTQGVGDLKVSAMYSILNGDNHHLLVNGGISIPTGSIQQTGGANSMYPNSRFPYNMQLGSGTFDLLPLINYTYTHDRLSLSAQAQSIIRLGYNTIGYNLGNQYTGNLWAGYRCFRSWSSTLRLEAFHSDGINGSDPSLDLNLTAEPSDNYLNYGGSRISTYVGTSYLFTQGALKNNSISAEFGIPIYQNYNGIQMSNTWSLYATWIYTFQNPFHSKNKNN